MLWVKTYIVARMLWVSLLRVFLLLLLITSGWCTFVTQTQERNIEGFDLLLLCFVLFFQFHLLILLLDGICSVIISCHFAILPLC